MSRRLPTPSQSGMRQLIHGDRHLPLAVAITRGREILIACTGKDYLYDLNAWHEYLVETNAKGYKTYNRHLAFAKAIKAVLKDERWKKAAAEAESQGLLEHLRDRDRREKEEKELAERTWSCKFRNCPKCQTSFKSVQDRGQCPECGLIFLASSADKK